MCKAPSGVARPFRTRPVPVELEAVAIRVAKIQRLADAVIAGAVKRDAGLLEPAKRVGERRAVRIADGEVIEAGRPGGGAWPATALPGVQADVVMVAAGTQERRRVAHPLGDLESEDAVVKGRARSMSETFRCTWPTSTLGSMGLSMVGSQTGVGRGQTRVRRAQPSLSAKASHDSGRRHDLPGVTLGVLGCMKEQAEDRRRQPCPADGARRLEAMEGAVARSCDRAASNARRTSSRSVAASTRADSIRPWRRPSARRSAARLAHTSGADRCCRSSASDESRSTRLPQASATTGLSSSHELPPRHRRASAEVRARPAEEEPARPRQGHAASARVGYWVSP